MVKVNGMNEDVTGMTIAQYLEKANYNVKRIVVERNEEIMPKTEYNRTVLQDGDTIEVIRTDYHMKCNSKNKFRFVGQKI